MTASSSTHAREISADSKTSETKISAAMAVESKKYRAEVGDTLIEFDEHIVRGDGKCGFTSLGTTREEVSALLLSLAGDEKARNELAPEIKGLLRESRESKFHTEETRKLFAELDQLELEVDQQVRNVNTQLGAIASVATPSRAYRSQTLDELIVLLKDSQDVSQQAALTTLRQSHQRLVEIDQQINDGCQSREVFERYLTEGLASTEWLGYRSAKLFAKLKSYNLYVFKPAENRPGWLELAERQECASPQNTFYLLHTNRFTHFNLLSIHQKPTLAPTPASLLSTIKKEETKAEHLSREPINNKPKAVDAQNSVSTQAVGDKKEESGMFSKLVFTVEGEIVEFHAHEIVRIAAAVLNETTHAKLAETKEEPYPKLPTQEFAEVYLKNCLSVYSQKIFTCPPSELPIAALLVPFHFNQPSTIKNWMFVTKSLADQYKKDKRKGWWCIIADRLIFIRNKDTNLFYVSDHGFIGDIMADLSEIVFDINWVNIPKEQHVEIFEVMDSLSQGFEKMTPDEFSKYKNEITQGITDNWESYRIFWPHQEKEEVLKDLSDKLSNDYVFRFAKSAIIYITKTLRERLKKLEDDYSDLYEDSLKLYKGDKAKAIKFIKCFVLKDIMLEINQGSHEYLFRPVHSYGKSEKGSSYRDFANSIKNYFQGSAALNSRQLAQKMRGILQGEKIEPIKEDALEFLPNLICAWFIAEPARYPCAMLSGLILLDMIENGISLMDGDDDLYSWVHTLIHPQKKPADNKAVVKIKDLYGHDIDLFKFDGTHPMAHDGSVADSKKVLGKHELSPVQQKEASLIMHWLYLRIKKSNSNCEVNIVEARKSPLVRRDHKEIKDLLNPKASHESKKFTILTTVIKPLIIERLSILDLLPLLRKIGGLEEKIEKSKQLIDIKISHAPAGMTTITQGAAVLNKLSGFVAEEKNSGWSYVSATSTAYLCLKKNSPISGETIKTNLEKLGIKIEITVRGDTFGTLLVASNVTKDFIDVNLPSLAPSIASPTSDPGLSGADFEVLPRPVGKIVAGSASAAETLKEIKQIDDAKGENAAYAFLAKKKSDALSEEKLKTEALAVKPVASIGAGAGLAIAAVVGAGAITDSLPRSLGASPATLLVVSAASLAQSQVFFAGTPAAERSSVHKIESVAQEYEYVDDDLIQGWRRKDGQIGRHK